MGTLAESVTTWLGRVELFAHGVDERRREALHCLQRGDPLAAREHAQALLQEVPKSPMGLAILADACEALGLDHEAVSPLQGLCESAPWRGELWVRLAEAMMRAGCQTGEVAKVLENVLAPNTDLAARRQALLILADFDILAGDAWRANHWLEALRFSTDDPDVALRRLEISLMVGQRAEIASMLKAMGASAILDGRAALAIGRARWLLGESMALDLLLRAFVLDAYGSTEALAAFLASSRDVVEVGRVKDVLQACGRLQEPSFVVALAMSEGREEDARRALARIARAGDASAAKSLYTIALDRKDMDALASAVEGLADGAPSEGRALVDAHRALHANNAEQALAALDLATSDGTSVGAIAHLLRVQAFSRWLDEGGDEVFRSVLAELRKSAGALDRLDLVAACEALAVEQKRPLRVAVVGEFNAGKSTFINALLGADVAPTGILPTTALLHYLSFAQDPFARIVTLEGVDRIVPHEGLKGALSDLRAQAVEVREVHICAPIERLRRIEVLDTPGFNAPDVDHVAVASRAVREAHVALWVLDGTQALKDSERRILARIADIGTPVQVIVNKRDRIAPERIDDLMGHVCEGLASVGLESMAGIVCFSARLALEGRLGADEAVNQSRWADVEAVIEAAIVNRSGVLRARALRRKAFDIASQLVALHETREAESQERDKAQNLASAATQLMNLDRTGCERIVKRLEGAYLRVQDDLRPLQAAGVGAVDSSALAYVEARLLDRVADPMVAALSEVAGLEGDRGSLLHEAVAPVLRGASATVRGMEGVGELRSWRVVRACAMAAHDRLMAACGEAEASGRVHPRWLRLRGLLGALGEREETGVRRVV